MLIEPLSSSSALAPKPRPSKPLTVEPVVEVDEQGDTVSADAPQPATAPDVTPADEHDAMTDKQKRTHYSGGCREQPCRDAIAKAARDRKAQRTAEATAAATAEDTPSTPDDLPSAVNQDEPYTHHADTEQQLHTEIAELKRLAVDRANTIVRLQTEVVEHMARVRELTDQASAAPTAEPVTFCAPGVTVTVTIESR